MRLCLLQRLVVVSCFEALSPVILGYTFRPVLVADYNARVLPNTRGSRESARFRSVDPPSISVLQDQAPTTDVDDDDELRTLFRKGSNRVNVASTRDDLQ